VFSVQYSVDSISVLVDDALMVQRKRVTLRTVRLMCIVPRRGQVSGGTENSSTKHEEGMKSRTAAVQSVVSTASLWSQRPKI